METNKQELFDSVQELAKAFAKFNELYQNASEQDQTFITNEWPFVEGLEVETIAKEVNIWAEYHDEYFHKANGIEKPVFSEAEKSCETFFNIKKHKLIYDSNPNYKSVIDEQSYAVGRKLYLEVTVVDGQMSTYLNRWLYGNTVPDKHIPFGCELNTIHFNIPGSDDLKKKLLDFLNEQ